MSSHFVLRDRVTVAAALALGGCTIVDNIGPCTAVSTTTTDGTLCPRPVPAGADAVWQIRHSARLGHPETDHRVQSRSHSAA